MRMSSANQLVGVKYAYTNIWRFISKTIFPFGILNQSSVNTEIQSGMVMDLSLKSSNWTHPPRMSPVLLGPPGNDGICLLNFQQVLLLTIERCPIRTVVPSTLGGKFNINIKNFFYFFQSCCIFQPIPIIPTKRKKNDDNQKEKQICLFYFRLYFSSLSISIFSQEVAYLQF